MRSDLLEPVRLLRQSKGPALPQRHLVGVPSHGRAPNRLLATSGACGQPVPSRRPCSPGLLPLWVPAGDTLGTGGGLKAQDLGASSLVQLGTGGHPGQPGHSRDLTVTRLLGEPLNLALTRPLPSTSSENLRESARVSRGSGLGSRGQQLRQAPGGLGRRRRDTGVAEQAQLGQACGGWAGSQRPLGEAITMPSSVGAVPRGCGWQRRGWPCGLVWGSPVPG